MKHCAFYHKETGLLHPVSVMLSDEKALAANTPTDHVAIDQPPTGPLDPLSQRIDITTKVVIDYQPPAPSAEHAWDATKRRWVLNAAAAAKASADTAARQAIAQLEASQHRPLRELALGVAGAKERLQAIDEQIAAYRKDLT